MKNGSRNPQNEIKVLINVVLATAQISIITAFILSFSDYTSNAYWTLKIISGLVVLNIIFRKKSASYKISWIIFVLLLPVFGVVLYFIWGEQRVTKKTKARWEEVNQETYQKLVQDEAVYNEICSQCDQGPKKTIDLVRRLADLPVWKNTKTTYFKVGEEMHKANLEAIRGAKRFIFLEYFIVSGGRMYDELMAALIERAQAGVEIRMMVDAMGSLTTLPVHFFDDCAKHNIQSIPVNPLSGSFYKFISFRDHRKMTVVDGRIAINGGINIGDEYINAIERFGHWKDMAIQIEGDAVLSYTAMFLHMWSFLTNEKLELDNYRCENEKIDAEGFVMPFCDGPMNYKNPAENVYMNIFATARKYVYISTPYLILDSDLTNCILMAVRSGVEVRIITPGIPDKKLVYATTRAFYGDLLREGVKIYEYTPGFNHGKVLVADDTVSIVGSINMDYRSLTWNYECGTWIHDEKRALEIKKDLLDCTSQSKEIRYKEWEENGFLQKVMQSILRIAAPLM
ncbi:MAG: cardiolipin synthase [Eubacteriaceae bacterium]